MTSVSALFIEQRQKLDAETVAESGSVVALLNFTDL